MTAQAMSPKERQPQDVERETAFWLASLMRREFGLTPSATSATLAGEMLRVRLEGALSPMARLIAESPDGPQILRRVHTLFFDANRLRMHALIGRIVGRPIRRSALAVDLPGGDVLVWFELGPRPGETASTRPLA